MADLGTDLGHLVALMLGALCVLMGFILVARGVGTTDSESSLRIAGVEFKLSKVGPGILFALIGVMLVWLGMQPQGGKAKEEAPPAVGNTTAPVANEVADNPAPPPVEPREQPTSPEPKAIAPPVTPASDPSAGIHEREADALRRGLAAMTSGNCPAELFQPAVQFACQQQLGWAPANLQARGPIRSIDYEGPYSPGNSLSVFRVRFDNSEMRWAVSLGGDGRLVTMASPG